MAMIHPGGFDSEICDLCAKAWHSRSHALQALLKAAEYIKAGKLLPMALDQFIADAIENAVKNPYRGDPINGDEGQALLFELRLKNNNRRQSGSSTEIGSFMEDSIDSGLTYKQAVAQAVEKFSISPSTAKAKLAKYREDLKEYWRLQREESE